MRLRDFNETFDYQMRDPQIVPLYLEEASLDGLNVFLIAFGDVVRANGGIESVAERCRLSAEALRNELTEVEPLTLDTVTSVVMGLGCEMPNMTIPTHRLPSEFELLQPA